MTNKLTPIALFTSPFSFRMIQIFQLDTRLVTLHSVTLTVSCKKNKIWPYNWVCQLMKVAVKRWLQSTRWYNFWSSSEYGGDSHVIVWTCNTNFSYMENRSLEIKRRWLHRCWWQVDVGNFILVIIFRC